jgi:hypothetical protein
MDNTTKKKLWEICLAHRITENEYSNYNGTIPIYNYSPYVPYLPKNWNKILVLGTSQKISLKNNGDKDYRDSLKDLSEEYLIFRLGNPIVTDKKAEQFIGVEPWDEGFLKLAMLSCFPKSKLSEFGVSNAFPWELDKNNKPQNYFLEHKSLKFWEAVLPVIKPEYLICIGNATKFHIVLGYLCKEMNIKYFSLLSPYFLKYILTLFDENDLYWRFPEVRLAFETNQRLVKSNNPYWKNYVLFAAHAVSKIKIKAYLSQNK